MYTLLKISLKLNKKMLNHEKVLYLDKGWKYSKILNILALDTTFSGCSGYYWFYITGDFARPRGGSFDFLCHPEVISKLSERFVVRVNPTLRR